MSYQSPYITVHGQGSSQQRAAPAAHAPPSSSSSSSSSSATGSLRPRDPTLPPGTVRLTNDIYIGPPRGADGETFSPDSPTIRDENDGESTTTTHTSKYPEPSPGGYHLPATHAFTSQIRTAPVVRPPPRPIPLHLANVQSSTCLVEYPLGSKRYHILECLKCFAAFDGIGSAVMHFMHVPVHAELRGVVNVENVVEICGCWVVDAREADYVRMGSVARHAAARAAGLPSMR